MSRLSVIQDFLEALFTFFPNKNEVFGDEQEKESICATIKLSRNMEFPTKLGLCATSKGSVQPAHTIRAV